jgi:hypothetical protein
VPGSEEPEPKPIAASSLVDPEPKCEPESEASEIVRMDVTES